MCSIWEWQATIVKDLNDSQDPEYTLFCRENVFVAIYVLFSDNKCALFARLMVTWCSFGNAVIKADFKRPVTFTFLLVL